MLYLNLGIYSQRDVYIKIHLRVPNAGTVRIPLYGARWLYQPASATHAFESNITLSYCRSSQFLENTSPSLHFFLLKHTYKVLCLTSFFFFYLLQVVVTFPWFEKQSVQGEIISLVRQTNVQKKLGKFPGTRTLLWVFTKTHTVFPALSLGLKKVLLFLPPNISCVLILSGLQEHYETVLVFYGGFVHFVNSIEGSSSMQISLMCPKQKGWTLTAIQTISLTSVCRHPVWSSPLWTVVSYSKDPEKGPVWLILAVNLYLHFSLLLKQFTLE